MAKILPLVTFKGRKAAPLFYAEEAGGKTAPLTSFNLFKAAATNGPANQTRKEVTLVIWRKMAKALDAIEAAEAAEVKKVTLEDDWYDLLRPIADQIMAIYGVNAPTIEDALNEAITKANVSENGAKPKTKK